MIAEISLAYGRQGSAWATLAVFALLILLCGFSLPQAPQGGIAVMAMLAAALVAASQLYTPAEQSGELEQWLLRPTMFEQVIAARLAAHWCAHFLPMVALISAYHASTGGNFWWGAAAAFSVSVALLALSSLASAFGLSVRETGMIPAIVVLPLAVPTIIFGTQFLDILPDFTAVQLSAFLTFSLASCAISVLISSALIKLRYEC